MSRGRWALLVVGIVTLAAILVLPTLIKQSLAGLGDPAYPYWVLNDSDGTVLLDVHADLHETFVVPAHSYGPFASPRSIDAGWTIAVVDQECAAVFTLTLDSAYDLVYISPDGRASLAAANAWGYGLRTAKGQEALSRRNPSCPDGATTIAPTP
jgi:hypothetical protein